MRRFVVSLLALAALSVPAFAGGGGGVTAVASSSGTDLTGTYGVEALGYGILEYGVVIGGYLEYREGNVSDYHASVPLPASHLRTGSMGLVQGLARSAGPLQVMATLWPGFGGTNVYDATGFFGGEYSRVNGFALFGKAEAEVGVTTLPWMKISAVGDLSGQLLFASGAPTTLWTPELGVRVTWGWFRN